MCWCVYRCRVLNNSSKNRNAGFGLFCKSSIVVASDEMVSVSQLLLNLLNSLRCLSSSEFDAFVGWIDSKPNKIIVGISNCKSI